VLRVSDQGDLAVLRTERPPTGLTPIPLAPNDDTVQMGEPVIILGYPGTFDSLLSRLPAATSQEVLRIAGTQPLKLAETLSQKRLVRPLATQGHISDISPKVITYEARSASGSSGGAVLNRKGGVIAVNHSVLRRIGGVNLGLPIRFARELIAPLNGTERN